MKKTTVAVLVGAALVLAAGIDFWFSPPGILSNLPPAAPAAPMAPATPAAPAAPAALAAPVTPAAPANWREKAPLSAAFGASQWLDSGR